MKFEPTNRSDNIIKMKPKYERKDFLIVTLNFIKAHKDPIKISHPLVGKR